MQGETNHWTILLQLGYEIKRVFAWIETSFPIIVTIKIEIKSMGEEYAYKFLVQLDRITDLSRILWEILIIHRTREGKRRKKRFKYQGFRVSSVFLISRIGESISSRIELIVLYLNTRFLSLFLHVSSPILFRKIYKSLSYHSSIRSLEKSMHASASPETILRTF